LVAGGEWLFRPAPRLRALAAIEMKTTTAGAISACTHLAPLAILARFEGGCGKKTGGARNLPML
jgi:hypothetical protein